MSLTDRLWLIAAEELFGEVVCDRTTYYIGCYMSHDGYSSTPAGLAELVDALDSGSSVRKDFRVQVPGSASLGICSLLKGH